MPNQPKTPGRNVRVSDATWQAAKQVAAERGETVTAVIVRALKSYAETATRP
jgi:hypothetical protein